MSIEKFVPGRTFTLMVEFRTGAKYDLPLQSLVLSSDRIRDWLYRIIFFEKSVFYRLEGHFFFKTPPIVAVQVKGHFVHFKITEHIFPTENYLFYIGRCVIEHSVDYARISPILSLYNRARTRL